MSTVRDFHDRAMVAVERMMTARAAGNDALANSSLLEALQAELEAANLALVRNVSPTTTLILLRSAANLARDAKHWEVGLDLAVRALSTDALREHRNELFRICDTFRTYEHLQLNGVELSDADVQLVVAGPEAAPGFARATEVTRRVEDMRNLMVRSAMRRSGMEFGKGPPRVRAFQEAFTPYLSVARAASYAVTVRFGVHEQVELDLNDGAVAMRFSVIDALSDVITVAKAYSEGGPTAVRSLIPDGRYAANTVALLRDLSPDTERINTVGLTIRRNGGTDAIALPARTAFDQLAVPWLSIAHKGEALPAPTFDVVGQLLEGGARSPSKAWATVVRDGEHSLKFKYDEATHGDVIQGYWKHRVRVTLRRTAQQRFVLLDIKDE